MSLTENKISIKNIVSKVYRDLQFETEKDFLDIIEWAVEALRFIGAYEQFEEAIECLEICNYRAPIPCNVVSILEVGNKGLQLSKGTSNRMPEKHSNTVHFPGIKSFAEKKLDSLPVKIGRMYNLHNSDETFIIENGWIKTSFKEGDLHIRYNSMPVDEEGIPLIPDHESYREALFWYISCKYFYREAIKEERYWKFYKDAEFKWQWYCGQAGAEAMKPDVFIMENIKRNFLSILPKVNSYKEFFDNLNDY